MPGELGAPDLTPYGYLRNPGHRARAWSDVDGGNLRTATEWIGVEWVYPLQRDPTSGAGIAVGATTRTCRYRSADVIELADTRFFLVDDDTLAAIGPLDLTPSKHHWGDLPAVHAFAQTTTDYHNVAILARARTEALAYDRARAALPRAESRLQQLLAADERFRATCPRLDGDWPTGWAEGLAVDIETSRLLVQPARGIFHDVWPSWMTAWPRVVLAEGTLDMLRLAFADPALAQRAVLSMFRDAPMPNVPCVFEDGGFNMLAADGSRCGTSPAWCLPFLNLELLYLRTVDRDWLTNLFPYLATYLEWWLRERVDPEGWVVYKCSWESGEDGNPRLDPTGSGEGVIDRRVRPVELQATLAHSAQVMGFFARELGTDSSYWDDLAQTYRRHTRALFDSATGRYRDWLVQEQRFQQPMPDRLYWGVDTGRFSPLALTPALIGEPPPDDELWAHATPPWTLWPSWTYALVESAAASGPSQRLGTLVSDIVGRVYAVTTRRDLSDLARPLPGSAPEFWPEDWSTYQGHDGYGWGATTANLLLRHVFGFQESRPTAHWTARLAPALPTSLLAPGRRYSVRRLTYRGLTFDLTYSVGADADRLEAQLSLDRPSRCEVDGAPTSEQPSTVHRFTLDNARPVILVLKP